MSMFVYGTFKLITEYQTNFIYYIMFFFIFSIWLGHQCLLHRYFTHKVIKVIEPLENIFYFIAVTASVGSPFSYKHIHLLHHRHADTKDDQHGPVTGLFTMPAILTSRNNMILRNSNNKIEDFTHNHYYNILYIFAFMLFLITPDLMIFYGFTAFICLMLTDLYNYSNHSSWVPGNYRNFDTKDNSHNNILFDWWAGTWHNNHHNNPKSETDKVKWYEFDLIHLFFIRPLKRYAAKKD